MYLEIRILDGRQADETVREIRGIVSDGRAAPRTGSPGPRGSGAAEARTPNR